MLELTDGTREQVRELKAFSKRAEDGEEGARAELRRALRASAPEVIARCGDHSRFYRHILAERMSGGDPLAEDATVERAERIALELAGDTPTPLEVLLSERVASLWVLTELQEALFAAYYKTAKAHLSIVLKMTRLQESTHRRYLAAIKTLAQVQKLQGPSRVQVNIGGNQVNVSR